MESTINLTAGTEIETPAVDFSNLSSIDEGCSKLGAYLGLDGPVSKDVFISAAEDPTYANNLFLSRVHPPFLRHVLNQPTKQWTDRPAVRNDKNKTATERSNGELLGRAARSFLKWTQGGFRKVDGATYQRRLAACQSCPHHIEPPDKIIYAVAGVLQRNLSQQQCNQNERQDNQAVQQRICDLCGCLTASKARFEHEFCPADHPDQPGLTRWNEPKP